MDFTALFTLEYATRLYCAPKQMRYAGSFFGIVDLLAVLPTYFTLFFPGGKFLLVIRVLRVLRIFRVFKLIKFVREANLLLQALRASRRKIFVFLYTVISLVIIFGSLMYVIETESNGFTSIPRSIYWAIVTLTTVGYGDISPATNLGQTLAALIMLLGYSIIAVPTGIVSAEIARATGRGTKVCPHCDIGGHDQDAFHCKFCGEKLLQNAPSDTAI
jgi:voltage-gated potassium channel